MIDEGELVCFAGRTRDRARPEAATGKVARDPVAVVKDPWMAIDRSVLLFFTTDEALIGSGTAA